MYNSRTQIDQQPQSATERRHEENSGEFKFGLVLSHINTK